MCNATSASTASRWRVGARGSPALTSLAALAKAEESARRSGVEATWVQADAARIPAHLHGRFDLAYATIGAICWIEDLPAWMRAVAATLRPGGRFVLVEIHPLLTMVAEREPFSLDFPYSFDGPHRFNEPGTYADPNAELASSDTVNFAHSLGETVTAAIEAGLRIDSLTEHVEASRSPRPRMVPREADGRTGSASTDSLSRSYSRCWRPSSTADPATGSPSLCADTRRHESRRPPRLKLSSAPRATSAHLMLGAGVLPDRPMDTDPRRSSLAALIEAASTWARSRRRCSVTDLAEERSPARLSCGRRG